MAAMTRRDALKLASNGFGYLSFSALAAGEALAAKRSPQPHFAPKATNVVLLFMPGGVSHMESFDPKPNLPSSTANTPNSTTTWRGLTESGCGAYGNSNNTDDAVLR